MTRQGQQGPNEGAVEWRPAGAGHAAGGPRETASAAVMEPRVLGAVVVVIAMALALKHASETESASNGAAVGAGGSRGRRVVVDHA